jgi:hypothetical protein
VVAEGEIADLRETRGVQLEVDLREQSDAFVNALAARGGSLTLQAGARYRFSFPGSANGGAAVARLLFEAAQESGAQVRAFHPAQRSLEDIFMEAVE